MEVFISFRFFCIDNFQALYKASSEKYLLIFIELCIGQAGTEGNRSFFFSFLSPMLSCPLVCDNPIHFCTRMDFILFFFFCFVFFIQLFLQIHFLFTHIASLQRHRHATPSFFSACLIFAFHNRLSVFVQLVNFLS